MNFRVECAEELKIKKKTNNRSPMTCSFSLILCFILEHLVLVNVEIRMWDYWE